MNDLILALIIMSVLIVSAYFIGYMDGTKTEVWQLPALYGYESKDLVIKNNVFSREWTDATISHRIDNKPLGGGSSSYSDADHQAPLFVDDSGVMKFRNNWTYECLPTKK